MSSEAAPLVVAAVCTAALLLTSNPGARVLFAYVGSACGGFAFVAAVERGSDVALAALPLLLVSLPGGLYAVARLAWTSR